MQMILATFISESFRPTEPNRLHAPDRITLLSAGNHTSSYRCARVRGWLGRWLAK